MHWDFFCSSTFFSVCNHNKLANFAFAGYDPSNPGGGYGQQGGYGGNNMNNNNPYGGYGGGYGQGGVGGYQVRKEKNLEFIIDYFTICFCYFKKCPNEFQVPPFFQPPPSAGNPYGGYNQVNKLSRKPNFFLKKTLNLNFSSGRFRSPRRAAAPDEQPEHVSAAAWSNRRRRVGAAGADKSLGRTGEGRIFETI